MSEVQATYVLEAIRKRLADVERGYVMRETPKRSVLRLAAPPPSPADFTLFSPDFEL